MNFYGMILTGWNSSPRTNTCLSATVYHKTHTNSPGATWIVKLVLTVPEPRCPPLTTHWLSRCHFIQYKTYMDCPGATLYIRKPIWTVPVPLYTLQNLYGLSRCHFIHYKTYMDCPGATLSITKPIWTVPVPVYPVQNWHGLSRFHSVHYKFNMQLI
jgi:hypothetical protein